ncbi:MAG: ShlB/FhaC/HecB family hemolysin secretion/activation protein [Methylotenera sp.]|nr:ShlB/FhaC/HecB family hemolysin secretion/activation protein [Methylotenera sp.]
MSHNITTKFTFLNLTISTMTLAMLQVLPVQAASPVAPDAGQTIRELQQQPSGIQQATPAAEDKSGAATDQGERVLVKSFSITGNQEIASDVLQALLADQLSSERSLSELKKLAARITSYYRVQGYAVARAYLPAQEIKDGVVVINIIEGRIDKHQIKNNARLDDARAEAYFDNIKNNDVIKTEAIDRSLLILQGTPGVGATRAVLQPGASVGTSELIIELDEAAPYSANVNLDNYGNRYTGEYRLGGTFYLNSPLNIGDQLTVSALSTGDKLNYGRIAYQLPVGSSGLRVGAAYFEAHYALGREFENLDADGKARSSSIFASYPFIRSQQTNLNGVLSLEQKDLSDEVNATNSKSDKRIKLANVGLSGSHRDNSGIWGAELSMIHGSLDIQTDTIRQIDATSANTDGRYTRWTYSLSRIQRITDNNQLAITLSGQQASKNLDSSEKFSLGGINGVRAYPQGEAVGDEGSLAKLELRHSFSPTLQCIAFYDVGEVAVSNNRYSNSDNHRQISGAGLGVNAELAGFQIKSSLAWRTSTTPDSIPVSARNNPTAWIQVGRVF